MSASHMPSRIEPGDRCLRFRAGLLCFGVVSLFSLLSWRLLHLQFNQHEHFQTILDESHHRSHEISASRGDILDARGRVLACDEPVQKVTFDLDFLQHATRLAKALAQAEGMKANDLRHAFGLEELQNRYLDRVAHIAAPLLEMTESQFSEKIRARLKIKPEGEVALVKNLSVSAALKLRVDLEAAGLETYQENRGNQGKIGGLIFQNDFARRYPVDLPLKHIVGSFGETMPAPGMEPKPARGVAGVERFLDADLTGKPGVREYEKDGLGREITAYRGRITPPRNGRNVRLSLDLGLQGVVEQALDETGDADNEVYLNDLNAERVVVVLFDPATMGVRAIGCRDKKHGPENPLLSNPATEMVYEPGSTLKMVTVAPAISSGKVSAQTRIDLGGGGVWDDSDITQITDEHAFSSLTVGEILVQSSNIGAYKLARLLGTRRFEEIIRDFGFCRRTGFESSSESRGSFAGNEKMTIQTLSRVSFGMAIQVTPAQMCGALGAIINDGNYQPLHLAESWVDDEGQPTESLTRQPPRRVVSAAASKAVRRAMVEVVEKGTGESGRSELFEIAGKTGTARKAVTLLKDGKLRTSYQGDLICSFIGFLPADKPRLGGLVIIDTPKSVKHAHYGGKMAAPLFRRIAERAMAYYEVPPQFSPEVRLLPQPASTTPMRATPRIIAR